MITFDRNSVRFVFRTAAVALRDGAVLVHRSERDEFWALPGGRVEMYEQAAHALAREMREELGADAAVRELLWVVENFFEYDGMRCHELGLYFRVELPEAACAAAPCEEFDGDEGGLRLIFRWQPLERLDEITVLPAFLATALRALPTKTTHVIQTPEGIGVDATTAA